MTTSWSLAKKVLSPGSRAVLRSAGNRVSTTTDRALELAGRKALRIWRAAGARQEPAATMAMLCIRRPVYVDMAVASINSLHYRNPAFRVLLHTDAVCSEAFEKRKRRLDYPQRVLRLDVADEASTPWQFTKLDVVLRMSSEGIAFVDADSRWHADPAPLISGSKAMFLVVVNAFGTVDWERSLVSRELRRPEWSGLLHFNTGFISIPSGLFTEEFAAFCRSLMRQIFELPDDRGLSEVQNRLRKHTCEEVALSIAAQTCIGADRISPLKTSDGPGNRKVLESYYYGALNRDGDRG